MKIDISNPLLILSDQTNKKIANSRLTTSEDVVCSMFEKLDHASTKASLILKHANDYLVELTEMMDFFANKNLLKEKKYMEVISIITNNYNNDVNLSNTLYNLTVAFYKHIDYECRNTPTERCNNMFRTLLNEATTLFNAINDAHDIFVDYYEQLKVKILNLEFSDNKNFPSKLIRLFHKFDKRLNVDIDEALYYKLLSAIKG